MAKHKKESFLTFVTVLVSVTVVLVITHARQIGDIEYRIVSAVDQSVSETGTCKLDLSQLFPEFEWDTVSVFVAGNPSQIYDVLKVDSDIFDGIVFPKEGQPLKCAMSTYQFPQDELPTITYYVERTTTNAPYYVSLTHDDAIVSVDKMIDENGNYKYTLYVTMQ